MPENDPAGYLPRVAQARKQRGRKPGLRHREQELEFAKDTGSPRHIKRAEANLKRLRDALKKRGGG